LQSDVVKQRTSTKRRFEAKKSNFVRIRGRTFNVEEKRTDPDLCEAHQTNLAGTILEGADRYPDPAKQHTVNASDLSERRVDHTPAEKFRRVVCLFSASFAASV
jgi:hypothetical protein